MIRGWNDAEVYARRGGSRLLQGNLKASEADFNTAIEHGLDRTRPCIPSEHWHDKAKWIGLVRRPISVPPSIKDGMMRRSTLIVD